MRENPYKSPEADKERAIISTSAKRILWIGAALLLSGIAVLSSTRTGTSTATEAGRDGIGSPTSLDLLLYPRAYS